MKPRKLIVLIVFMGMLLSACGGNSAPDVVDADSETNTAPGIADINSNASLLNFSDKLSVKFEEGVTQREKDVTNFAIGLIQKEFERLGLSFESNVHIASNRETYFDKRARSVLENFGISRDEYEEIEAENMVEYPDGREGLSSKGSAYFLSGDIFINLDLIRLLDIKDGVLDKDSRDVGLAYVLIHESYHVLQGRLTLGWRNSFMSEMSANIFAEKVLMQSQCEYYGSMEKLSLDSVDCDPDSVQDALVQMYQARFKNNEHVLRAMAAYMIEEHGPDVLTLLYANLGKCAEENFDVRGMDYQEAMEKYLKENTEKCFTSSLEKTVGQSEEEFSDVVESYAKNIK